MENKYYIYLHIKATDGEPFYVGKGKRYRFNSKQRSKHWHHIVNKYGYDIIFLEENLTESESFEKEIYWIKRIGRKDLGLGPLVNFTDGGEGNSGKIHSDETKEKQRIAQTGKTYSDASKKKMSEKKIGKVSPNKGKNISEEIKQKISESVKKLKQTHNKGRIYITNNITNKFILPEQLDKYISLGFKLGRDMSIYKK